MTIIFSMYGGYIILQYPAVLQGKSAGEDYATVSRSVLCGRQREPSIKTLSSSLSAKFWRHWVLSGATQRHTGLLSWSEEMIILINNKSFPRVGILECGIEATTVTLQSHPSAPAPRPSLRLIWMNTYQNI